MPRDILLWIFVMTKSEDFEIGGTCGVKPDGLGLLLLPADCLIPILVCEHWPLRL